MRRHNNRGVEIYYGFDLFNNTRGWALKPNIKDAKVFGHKVLNSNSRGIRGVVEYTHEKDPTKKRILVLGDSFTFGDELSDEETYPHYLQQLLPEFEVINFGVHGYGHDQMLIYLKEEGLKYDPDIIILGYIKEDDVRNILAFRDFAKPRFEIKNDQLKLRSSKLPSPETVLKREWQQSKLLDLLSIVFYKIQKKLGVYNRRTDILTEKILDEIITQSKNTGATPVFVYLSGLRDESPSGQVFFHKWKRKGINLVHVYPYVRSALKTGVKLKERGHYGPIVNKKIAQAIYEHLLKNFNDIIR